MKFVICLSGLLLFTACNDKSEFSEKMSIASVSDGSVISPEPAPIDPVVDPNPSPDPVIDDPAPNPDPVVVNPIPNPDPVVVVPTPNPEPKPDPVVVNPEPKPEPKPDPVVVNPEPKPEPKPDPVVVNPEPKPEPKPDPVVVPPVPKPDPVVVTPVPNPDPVVNPDPSSDQPTSGSGSCNYSFSATHVGSNVNVTIISAPMSKLLALENMDFDKLDAEDKVFFNDALMNRLALPVIGKKSSTTQKENEKLIIQNEKDASVSFTSLHAGTSLSYLIKGEKASIQGTSVGKGAKVHAVLDGKEASVSFTSIQDNSEVVLLFVSKGDNVNCVSTTGVNGKIHNYVYGEKGFHTESRITGTSMKNSSILQHVIGHGATKTLLKGTSISESKVSIKSVGGNNTESKLKFTSMGRDNNIGVIILGKDNSLLDVSGTHAGINALISMEIEGNKASGAKFSFTSESNLRLNGRIVSEAPYLNLTSNTNSSKSAIVNVSLIKK